jgi:hypothetical protein
LLDFADFFADFLVPFARLEAVAALPAFDVVDFAADFVADGSVDCADDCATSTDVLTSDVASSAPIAVTMTARPRAHRAAERFRADTDMWQDLKDDAQPWASRQL